MPIFSYEALKQGKEVINLFMQEDRLFKLKDQKKSIFISEN